MTIVIVMKERTMMETRKVAMMKTTMTILVLRKGFLVSKPNFFIALTKTGI